MADETVKVRASVRVHANGDWYVQARYGDTDRELPQQACGPNERLYWLTAELPIPKRPAPAEVAAGVEDVKGGG